MKDVIFNDLIVLELANNHWGKLDRGLKIIDDYVSVVKKHHTRVAIKLQIRNVESFIHKKYKGNKEIRYIKKTEATVMSHDDYATMCKRIIDSDCVLIATPFDEKSVDECVSLGVQILKIASSDLDDWVLIKKIADAKLPVIVSTGGSNLKQIDDIVNYFEERKIPLAINHCVSLYPTKCEDLNLNQIDLFRERYPNNVIGLSTHEVGDLKSSTLIAYSKGARTIERHIDIDCDNIPVSPYCSLPEDIDKMIEAYEEAKIRCGESGDVKRIPPRSEVEYLDALVRGVYAKYNLKKGDVLTRNNTYLAIPLMKGQLSCREIQYNEKIKNDVIADSVVGIENISASYVSYELKEMIKKRGL